MIAVSSSALSGFRLRPPAVAIQEDSFKQRAFVLVSATAGAFEPRSASFPGIEVSRFFDGLDMIGPGVVPLAQWFGASGDRGLQAYCGVGRKL